MNLNRLFKLYEDFDFNDVFDSGEEHETASAIKYASKRFALDNALDSWIKEQPSLKNAFKEINEYFSKKAEISDSFLATIKNIQNFDDFPSFFKGKELAERAFVFCENLETLTIPKQIESLPSCIFYSCQNLKRVKFEAAKDNDPNYQIVFPSNLNFIGQSAFIRCSKIKSIKFEQNSNLKHIMPNAFAYCNIESLDLSPLRNLLSIKSEGFLKNKISSLKFSDSLQTIESKSFKENLTLTSLDLSNTNVFYIGEAAFQFCINLSTAEFPKTLQEIKNYAFYNTHLKEVHIPTQCKLGYHSLPNDCKVYRDL